MNMPPFATLYPVRDGEHFYVQPQPQQPVYRAQYYTGELVWVVTHYEDVAAITKDLRFSQTKQGTLTAEELAALPPPIVALQALEGKSMLEADPPVHTRLRGLVHKAFTPKLIEGMRPRIQRIVDDLCDQITARGDGKMEFIENFAFPLPVIVIAELLGLPTTDRDKFRAWTEILTNVSPDDMNRVEQMTAAALEFTQYFAEQFELRREDPREDLISGLVAAREEGSKLNDVELHAMVLLLLAAGHETTVNLLGNSVLALLQNPQALERLRYEPSLIASAVEEFLRYCGPIHFGLRYAKESIQFRDVQFQRGDTVFMQLPAANRDPQRFNQPDQLDIGRADNRHLSFGQGVHYCIGAPLARLEAQLAISTLLRRFPSLALDIGGFEKQSNYFTHGLRYLHLTY
jgi:cytochrome P450